MRVGIDCRLWDESGVGRYIRNLVGEINEIEKQKRSSNTYFLFAKRDVVKESGLDESIFTFVMADIPWHSLNEQYRLLRLLNSFNLDLVHFTYYSYPIFYHKPFVITVHDLIIYHYPTGKASSLPRPMYYAKHNAYKFILKQAVVKSCKIIVPLEATKKDLVNTLSADNKKIVVTKEGYYISRKNTNFDTKKFGKYFLYVGNGYPHKNVKGLIGGFEKFREKNKGVTLLLVGREDFFYKRLKEEVGKGLFEDIVFLHGISDRELSSLYKNALSYISVSFMEGFGLTPLEAMSQGAPVILSDIPSFREVCGDAGIYCDPKDTNEIAKKMDSLYHLSKPDREKLSEKCRKKAGGFSWRKTAEKTLSIYESCTRV